jgi:hypothetical protein
MGIDNAAITTTNTAIIQETLPGLLHTTLRFEFSESLP